MPLSQGGRASKWRYDNREPGLADKPEMGVDVPNRVQCVVRRDPVIVLIASRKILRLHCARTECSAFGS